jgi:nucleoside-diphosphate-sugar epimerase
MLAPCDAFPPLPAQDLSEIGAGLSAVCSAWRGQRFFITGGTGFIGKWLVSSLLDISDRHGLGMRLALLSRDPGRFQAQCPHLAKHPAIEWIQGDVTSFQASTGHFDVVIHGATDVAAPASPITTFDACIDGTRRALEFAAEARCQRFLMLSSGAVYGRQPAGLARIPESFQGCPDTVSPSGAYGMGKLAAEWLTHTFALEHGFTSVVARCFAFVGPYLPLDRHFAIGNFLADAIAGRPIRITGDGTPIRSYMHGVDLSVWLLRLLQCAGTGSTVNVGGEEAVSIADLAGRVVALLGSNSPVEIVGVPVAGTPPLQYVPDLTQAREGFGLKPTVSLDEAIVRTASWIKSPPRA